ncbi:ead/Ea22-like family protein [Salmonella enterica]|nr:ead/Ea22-like family protein [Salmonella enterica]EJX0554471.1 ead/Ea22-like family protein [Salmonella enterica]EJX0602412.1 ead/Ea22-like family protein [Salmonella enterica]
MNIDKQALREAAEKADSGEWSYEEFNRLDLPGGAHIRINGRAAVYCLNKATGGIEQSRAMLAHIAAFSPKVALALLDELDVKEEQRANWFQVAQKLGEDLDAAEKRNAEQSKAASVDSQWKPDVCPITGRRFFMWIEHPSRGYVPTYGGPFDSYTIPTRDSSGEFSCERYDHDFGGWVGGEFIGLYLIDDDEQYRVCELEERIAELEAKLETADRLQDSAFRDGLKAGFSYGQTDDQSGFAQCMSAYSTRAGIKREGE